FGRPSRELALASLELSVPTIHAGTADWLRNVRERLAHAHRVSVILPLGDPSTATASLLTLIAEEFELSYLMLTPAVTRVDRTADGWAITLELRNLSDA